eukprot:3874821-Prymnesium_polylepis.2
MTGAAPGSLSSLGPLPPIDAPASTPPKAALPPTRSAEEQAALEAELDEMHELLGVKRGDALKESMRPELVVPSMPTPDFAVPAPAIVGDEQAMLKLAAAAQAERR